MSARLPHDDAAPDLDWSAPSSRLTGAAWRLMVREIIAVLAVSLGINALHATVSFIGSLTERQALSTQYAVLNGSQAPGRPWLDLFLQLVSIASGLGARSARVLPARQERRAALVHRGGRHAARP